MLLSSIDIFLRGVTVGLASSITVGPVAVLCIQRTLSKSRHSGFISGLGVACADTLMAIIAFFFYALLQAQIEQYKTHPHSEGRYATPAVQYYDRLVARYGKEKAYDIRFAEVFQVCEYGKKLTPELEKELFPF